MVCVCPAATVNPDVVTAFPVREHVTPADAQLWPSKVMTVPEAARVEGNGWLKLLTGKVGPPPGLEMARLKLTLSPTPYSAALGFRTSESDGGGVMTAVEADD